MSPGNHLWHRLLLRASLAMAQIFAWIFVFQYFFALTDTLESATISLALTYALTQVITILFTPIAAAALRNGYRRLMMFAVLALASAFTVLAASIIGTSYTVGWGITAFAFLMGVYRAFYWAPYRVASERHPARHPLWSEYLLAFLPLIAGFILDGGGASAIILLAIAAAFALAAIIPLFSMRDTHEGFAWGYRESVHQLFVGSHRRATISSMLHGIEMSLLLIVWPVIVFVILGWSYALLGIVLSLIYILSLLVRSIVRPAASHFSAPTRALLAASAWIIRLSVVGSVGIILVDLYYYGASNASSRGFDMMTLEHAADNTTYVDEYTVLKEISMAMGRLIMSLTIAILASYMSITVTFGIVFLIGALAAAGGVLFSARAKKIRI